MRFFCFKMNPQYKHWSMPAFKRMINCICAFLVQLLKTNRWVGTLSKLTKKDLWPLNFKVQIRPWRLSDADYVLDASMPLDPRKTVFVGGVPRPLKASKRDYLLLWHDSHHPKLSCLSSRVGHDHGSPLWRCLLRWHRHWSWTEISG